jgi:hypothetical protein
MRPLWTDLCVLLDRFMRPFGQIYASFWTDLCVLFGQIYASSLDRFMKNSSKLKCILNEE